jgi:hypothetical protein
MILRNYYKTLATPMYPSEGGVACVAKYPNGDDLPLKRPYLNTTNTSPCKQLHHLYNSLGFLGLNTWGTNPEKANTVIFGDGDAPVSFDDYKISGSVISGLSVTPSISCEDTDKGYVKRAIYSIVNNNSTAITIKEIGYTGCGAWGSNYAEGYPLLTERTVLEKPLTIEPGGTAQLTYEITLFYAL